MTEHPNPEKFFQAAQAYFEALTTRLEKAGLDVDPEELSLSFLLPGESTPYLLNVHKSRQEIWLSSPARGGYRFVWTPDHAACWRSERHPQSLDEFLREDLGDKGIVLEDLS